MVRRPRDSTKNARAARAARKRTTEVKEHMEGAIATVLQFFLKTPVRGLTGMRWLRKRRLGAAAGHQEGEELDCCRRCHRERDREVARGLFI